MVAKELPNTIYEISVSEAVNYVLPMVLKIAIDHDDNVRESFVSELDKIIMFYYTVRIQNDKLLNGITDLHRMIACTSST